MSSDRDHGRVGSEFIGHRRAAFGGTAVIFRDEFKLEAVQVTEIINGDEPAAGDIDPVRGVAAGHGRAHADLHYLAGFEHRATESVGSAFGRRSGFSSRCFSRAGCLAGADHQGKQDEQGK